MSRWARPTSRRGRATRFGYTGQTFLPDAYLYYYKARVYDPKYGRFLQIDPIGSQDDIDLYSYTGGDPINLTDPSGETPQEAADWAVMMAKEHKAAPNAMTTYETWGFNLRARGLRGVVKVGFGSPKCNLFVYDALEFNGVGTGLYGGAPSLAKVWANPNDKISNYRVLGANEKLQPGDVISNGEHVGIYTPRTNPDGSVSDLTTSAASADLDPATHPGVPRGGGPVTNDWGFRRHERAGYLDSTDTVEGNPRFVARRYTGKATSKKPDSGSQYYYQGQDVTTN